MTFFKALTLLPEDPIFRLPIAFSADPRPNKVNLGIGSYKDSEGLPYPLLSVKKAEAALLAKGQSKEYLPIDGDQAFLKASKELLFGKALADTLSAQIVNAQTLGGTGALRVGADFLCREATKNIFVSNPTWPNHQQVFTYSGMQTFPYRYYDDTTNQIDFAGLCADIGKIPAGSCILLHTNCHNPTGMDPSFDQWQELSALIKKQKLIPFFDTAYQGFKDSVDEDAKPIRYFASQGHEMLVANSYSKNFGLYGERVGSLHILTNNQDTALKTASHIKQLIRANYSNPPRHGAAIVAEILLSEPLRKEWLIELGNMRERLKEMRHTLIAGLQSAGTEKDWSFLKRQTGFFSFCGLNKDQVQRLTKDFAIYLPANGRINVGGLNGHNTDYVIDALINVSSP